MFNKYRLIGITLYTLVIFLLEYYLIMHAEMHAHKTETLIISVLITFIFFNMGKMWSVILNVISLSFILFDVYIVQICELVTDGNIIAIVGTSLDLAFSMLKTVPIYVILGAVLLLCLSGYISWKLAEFNKKYIKFSLLAMIIPILLTVHSIIHNALRPTSFYENSFMNVASITKHHMAGMPGDVLFGIAAALHPGDPLFVKPLPKHAITDASVLDKNGPRIHNIVFIMGESSVGKRYGIYGYKDADTTPVLNELYKEGKICVIKNAHSAANLTRKSVPMTFSFYGPGTRNYLITEKNILELAQEHQYKTFWISAQGGTGPYARPFGYISEYSNFVVRGDLHNKEYGVVIEKDDTLLPIIEKKFAEADPYKLYVIHIFGSHEEYKSKVMPEDRLDLPNASDYDRSIHHTDRVIGKIIKLADKELGDYTLIYTSDHGEVVKKKMGHGIYRGGHGLQYGGYDQYDVPFFLHDPGKQYCKMVQTFEEKRGYYTALANKYLLLSMIGYPFSENEIEKLIPEQLVIHSDDKVYKYSDIPQLPSFKKHPS